jgi:hypothetical protein
VLFDLLTQLEDLFLCGGAGLSRHRISGQAATGISKSQKI